MVVVGRQAIAHRRAVEIAQQGVLASAVAGVDPEDDGGGAHAYPQPRLARELVAPAGFVDIGHRRPLQGVERRLEWRVEGVGREAHEVRQASDGQVETGEVVQQLAHTAVASEVAAQQQGDQRDEAGPERQLAHAIGQLTPGGSLAAGADQPVELIFGHGRSHLRQLGHLVARRRTVARCTGQRVSAAAARGGQAGDHDIHAFRPDQHPRRAFVARLPALGPFALARLGLRGLHHVAARRHMRVAGVLSQSRFEFGHPCLQPNNRLRLTGNERQHVFHSKLRGRHSASRSWPHAAVDPPTVKPLSDPHLNGYINSEFVAAVSCLFARDNVSDILAAAQKVRTYVC
ncbi:MAG: hypothetical protein JWM80_6620 [Cyanobacteria bacterium RYN_339]|nr:hypothetical protein [Cyanobacteria bacterium RYN_339]